MFDKIIYALQIACANGYKDKPITFGRLLQILLHSKEFVARDKYNKEQANLKQQHHIDSQDHLWK